MLRKNSSGFTLVELLVTMAIIGVLAAIAVPQFSEYRRGVKDRDAQLALRRVVIAQEAYFIQNSIYLSCDESDCDALLPEINGIASGIEIEFISTGDACTGTASHLQGTGAVFDWSS